MSVRSCVIFLITSTLINYILCYFISQPTNQQINDFWINNWQTQDEIHGVLAIGYHVAVGFTVLVMAICKRFLGRIHYFLIVCIAFMANMIDLAFMWPTLWTYADDPYLASWKMLTIVTFKASIQVICLPVGWIFYRRYSHTFLRPSLLNDVYFLGNDK